MSSHGQMTAARARRDFDEASRSAAIHRLWAGLTGQNRALVPFEDLKRTLGFINQHYRGLQAVPLDKIIGSLGRSRDFDREFLPRFRELRGKWVSVDSAYLDGITLPPISLYKVDDAYFVVDGHHRVSVARQKGQTFIDAEVIEVQSRIPVTPNLTMDDLDTLAAYRQFLDDTRLDKLRPDQNLRLTMPGDYGRLLDHIRMHKYFVETDERRELGWEDAVTHWYDHVYTPVLRAIRRDRLLDDFPNHTEADLYIWIIEHAYFLSQELGHEVDPSQVGRIFASRFGKRPRRLLERITRSLRNILIPDSLEAGPPAGTWREERPDLLDAPHMFRNILVTVTGAESGWLALSQAAEIARREQSTLHGLHVVTEDDPAAEARGREVLDEFSFRCQGLGVQSTRQLVKGDVADQIIERARWVDLVAINQRREHGRWAERPLGTIFQTVTEQAARPILAVPGIDGVFVGPSDFSIAWTNGQKMDPALEDMMDVIAHIGARAMAANKYAGIYVVDPALVGRFSGMGYRLVALGGEHRYMALGAASLLEAARASQFQ